MSTRHEIAMALQNHAGPIYITSHNNPDGDAIGSLLALFWALKSLKKEVFPVMQDDIPDHLRFLPGAECIRKPNFYKVSNKGILVSVDVSGRTRMNIPEDWQLPLLVIDHHLTGKLAEGVIWCEPGATATGELIAELAIEEWNLEISKEMATCLYLAIASDSGFFKYSNTTPKVLRIAANLVEKGASPNWISENFEIRSFHTLQRLAVILSTLQVDMDGWIAEMTIISEPGDVSGFSEGFVDFPRSIPSAQIAILYKVIDEKNVRVSLRSKGANVAKVAEKLGGGGHYRAAGLTFSGTLEECKVAVHTALKQLREEG